MGADYHTYMHLGLKVTKADFVKEVTETVVVCDHPEAEGTRFCPICGTKASQRTKEVTKEVWASDAIAAAMQAQDIEDWEDAQYDLCDGTPITDALDLYSISSSSMDDNDTLILGDKLGRIGGWGNEWLSTIDIDTLAEQREVIGESAKALGLDKRVCLYISHYCSV